MRAAENCRDLRVPTVVALVAVATLAAGQARASTPPPHVTLRIGAPASAALRVIREGSEPTPPRSPVVATASPTTPALRDDPALEHPTALLVGRVAPPPPAPCADLSALLGIPSHHAGFVSNYPHDDGPAEDVYNATNQK